ncbi:MAG: hypothetical protein HYX77_08940 [Acidobacteria bacterium]|nr:hypothetical protein [Acidobacteriota bacterium]
MASLIAAGVVATALPVLAQRAPAHGSTNLSPEILSLACAPSLAFQVPPRPLRITGSQESFVHRSFAPGDLVAINAGGDNGIAVGQEYYTRRAVPIERRPVSRDNPATIRTTGWIRIYAVDPRMSLATITHACDSVEVNDYLSPFVLPDIPEISVNRPAAQRGNYGRVLTGNDNRTSFARDDYFLVDRGSDHGVTAGAHFVVYRDKREPGNFLFELGEAVAIEVRPESSTLRITLSRDAFIAGDYVALRK